uniref:Uncharacterized protein n=1 Tax=Heterorhabditis bacteriophora TaxID=37862 RepID=A0A1I7WTS9_HETBA
MKRKLAEPDSLIWQAEEKFDESQIGEHHGPCAIDYDSDTISAPFPSITQAPLSYSRCPPCRTSYRSTVSERERKINISMNAHWFETDVFPQMASSGHLFALHTARWWSQTKTAA